MFDTAYLIFVLFGLFLFSGYFPLAPVYCLAWICLDVLFCTASIMHLCTISVDRYLSLRYPMSFGRNKTRRRVTLKILVVWILSFALSLPLSLMYSQVRMKRRLSFFLHLGKGKRETRNKIDCSIIFQPYKILHSLTITLELHAKRNTSS